MCGIAGFNWNDRILLAKMIEFLKQRGLDNLSMYLKFNIKYYSSIIKYPFNFIFSHFENLLKYLIKFKKSFKLDMILSQFHPIHYASVIGGYLSKILKLPHFIRSHDLFILDVKQDPLLFQIYNFLIYLTIHKSIFKCDNFYVATTEMQNPLYN
ncbi:hypothetical protein LCGC14_1066910 [marine sediment metagenome]|uniref:Glycosyltransferase subfamily 4-like N-terminal domain-containing protein n=1 Tax=marine sediment metagenome TaxID=412755 RepID=A0A0F9N6H5_9ZZZZ